MAKSLQEQLLTAGLISNAKAKTAKTEKRKQVQQQRKNNLESEDETRQRLEQAKAEQIQRDKLLNQQRQQEAEKKAIAAQIKQLIDEHKQAQDQESGSAYNFTDGKAVKKIYINETMRQAIIRGRSAVVKSENQYYVVSAEVAEKIRARDKLCVLVLNTPSNQENNANADDPYAAYQIPEDLIW